MKVRKKQIVLGIVNLFRHYYVMDVKLNHIAIAVSNIDQSISFYEQLGLQFSDHREVVESQKVKTAFCKIDEFAKIELLEPTDESSSIQKFLDKKGQGVHHLCFEVADVKEMQAKLESQGKIFTSKEPFIGAGNCLVNFIHPKSTGGVLIELSQKLKGDK